MRIFFLLGCLITFPVLSAEVTPLPYLGHGCPTGYSISGSFCKPSGNARPAVIKEGACPYNWSPSAKDYCLANSKDAETAIPRNGGSCPYGYSISGGYCVSK